MRARGRKEQSDEMQSNNPLERDTLLSDKEEASTRRDGEEPLGEHGAQEEEQHLLGRHARSQPRSNRSRRARYQDEIEDGPESSTSNSPPTSDLDVSAFTQTKPKLGSRSRRARASRCACCGRYTAISLLIAAFFLCLVYGAYLASPHGSLDRLYAAQTLSNGTHLFEPTTILISLDGFRADFLHRNLTPHLQGLMRSGVSPEYTNPSFPSLTFPNHYTLVTGCHPETHGIVANKFFDPITQKVFHHVESDKSMQPEWWNSVQPLWVTAELAGLRSAIHMWPGSEVHIGPVDATYVDKFKMDEELDRKVRRVLGWLDLPGSNDANADENRPRPQLIAAYVPNVDTDGHKHGPNSTYIRSTIREVDGMIGQLLDGLQDRNLTDIVNVIVVSDHGMATVKQVVQLDDLVDRNLIEYTDGWPLYGLRPFDDSLLNAIHTGLLQKSKLPQYQEAFDVYWREEIPERYHFVNNPRIAPLWIIPRVGWAIATKEEFDVAANKDSHEDYHPRGLHGYDNEHPLMRSIFVAKGPAFPHPQGSRVQPFQNTEVYNVICDSLGIEPQQNNGTIRLPFRVQGLHDFDELAKNLPEPDDMMSDADVAELLASGDMQEAVDGSNDEQNEQTEGEQGRQGKPNALNRFLNWTGHEWQSIEDAWHTLFGHKDDAGTKDT